ncbi:hypothetical protein CHRY9293_03497 [Chryseobacterium potabilaquae]|uniref:Uncharacterized protein n=1 Tax=Chryseobacterium potabilaquae TaxID=2675057 RepID=A0A6N4XFK5_9FLAO|nr:hypothetical protein CHRY9293_03497 [Chryseobacterium potabilaquae]
MFFGGSCMFFGGSYMFFGGSCMFFGGSYSFNKLIIKQILSMHIQNVNQKKNICFLVGVSSMKICFLVGVVCFLVGVICFLVGVICLTNLFTAT